MNKRGFTLIEILSIIVLLGIVAFISTAVISNLIDKSKKDAFENSVYSAIRAYTNEESYQHFNELGEVEVTNLSLDHNPFVRGIVKRNDNNEIIVVNVTDGNYCANGSKNNLTITEGICSQ